MDRAQYALGGHYNMDNSFTELLNAIFFIYVHFHIVCDSLLACLVGKHVFVKVAK